MISVNVGMAIEPMRLAGSDEEHQERKDHRSHILKTGRTPVKKRHISFLDSARAYFVVPHMKKDIEKLEEEYDELHDVCIDQEDEVFRHEYLQELSDKALANYWQVREALTDTREQLKDAVARGDESEGKLKHVTAEYAATFKQLRELRQDYDEQSKELATTKQQLEKTYERLEKINSRARKTIARLEEDLVFAYGQHKDDAQEMVRLRKGIKERDTRIRRHNIRDNPWAWTAMGLFGLLCVAGPIALYVTVPAFARWADGLLKWNPY